MCWGERVTWVTVLVLVLMAPAAPAAETFSFVVMGETAGATADSPAPMFLQARNEINMLRPKFVVNLGDVVDARDGEDQVLSRRWDAFEKVRSSFDMTHFLVVGHRDVSGAASEHLFRQRYGPLWYSFDHGGRHFVVLDSEVVGQQGKIAGEQLAWLKQDLERARDAVHTFVFVHRPLWRDAATRSAWLTDVHPMLASRGVDAVFAGQQRRYLRDAARDGVQYYVTGGGGSPIEGDPLSGHFFHYLWVKVDGANVDVAVVRTGWLEADDVVTVEKVQSFTDALTEVLRLSPVPFSTESAERPVRAAVTNGFGRPCRIELDWQTPKGIAVRPAGARVELAAEQNQTVDFVLTGPTWPIESLPVCRATIVMDQTRRTVEQSVLVHRELDVPATATSPTLDGLIDEPFWRKAAVVRHFFDDRQGRSSSLGAKAMLAWDTERFYVAMVMPEAHPDRLAAGETEGFFDEAWRDDSIEIHLHPRESDRQAWHFVVNCRGAFLDDHVSSDPDAERVWQSATHIGKDSWSAEVIIPFAAVGGAPKAGDVWGANFCRNRRVEPAESSAWSPSRDFHDTSRFGRVRFVGKPAE